MQRMKVELPLGITADILSRLPVYSIVECKLVCKTWQTLINNDFGFLFAYNTSSTALHCQTSISNNSATEAEAEAQPFGCFTLGENQLRYGECYQQEEAHFKFTKPFNNPPLPHHPYYQEEKLITRWAILGSSNGLICLSACRFNVYERNIFTYNIYVYNPMTREFVDVGTETHMAGVIGGTGVRASGFGYHPSTNKYKVVRINYETNLSRSGQVKVYTLGSSGTSRWRDRSKKTSRWRDIGIIPFVIRGVRKPGVLVNGALYWITLDEKILSFDLEDEKFRIVSKPWEIDPYNCTRLGVLRGCLSAGIRCTDVWIMNNNKLYMSNSNSTTTNTTDDDSNSNSTTDDDDEASWTRLTIAFNKPPGDINDHWVFNEISSYGLKYESFDRFFHLHDRFEFDKRKLHLVPYTKSFVSLKALGEENVKKIC